MALSLRCLPGLMLLVTLTTGCQRLNTGMSSSPATSSPGAGAVETPLKVTTTSAKLQVLRWQVEQPATVLPFESAPLVAKLPGYVEKVHHDLGDEVPAGTVLATLSIPELEHEANQKKALAELAQAEVEQAQQNVRVAEEQVLAAESAIQEVEASVAKCQADFERWNSEFQRFESLVMKEIVDKQALEETRKQMRAAKAALQEAQAKLSSTRANSREAVARRGRAEADLKAAKARVNSAEAEARRLAALLDYRAIRAPFPGVVSGRFVHPGHFLQPMSGTKAEPLFTLDRVDKVRVAMDVPEAAAAYVDVGTPASIRVTAMNNREWTAKVSRTAKVLTADSRTLRIEIDLDRKDHPQIPRPGLYAYVKLDVEIPNALMVPMDSVLFADETAYVYLVNNDHVYKHRVQVGRSSGRQIQVLAHRRASINAGEFVPFTDKEVLVVGNLGALTDGQRVTSP